MYFKTIKFTFSNLNYDKCEFLQNKCTFKEVLYKHCSHFRNNNTMMTFLKSKTGF